MLPGEKSHAVLTIHGAADMSDEGRKSIANWLRMHAKMLMREGDNYAKCFRGRYITDKRVKLAKKRPPRRAA